MSFYPEAKIGVLGVNGSGKSTLLRIMAGMDQEFTGEAWAAEGARVGYLPQGTPARCRPRPCARTSWKKVAASKAILDRYNELAANYSDENADEMTQLQDEIEAKGLWDLLGSKVDQAMDALVCPPDDAKVATLSGGERRRVALCRLLLEQPELLLLDEPTNHLDAETVNWLEGHLRNYPGAILIVTHDRYFLDNVTGWILELDRGRGIPYQGNYSAWLGQKRKRLEQEGREEEARQRTLAREQEWIAASPRARQAKSKARYQRYDELLAKASDKAATTAQIVIPVAERLGQNVVDFDHLAKGYGDNLLIDDLTFKLPPGGIVGIIGANGAGKVTLCSRMIIGGGEARRRHHQGQRVGQAQLSSISRATASAARRPCGRESPAASTNFSSASARSIPAPIAPRFNFKGADQQKKVGSLSMERRAQPESILPGCSNPAPICCCSTSPPTTLTSTPCNALEEAMENFAGCAVIISHDRWFLDRIATHILAFEGDSHVEWFEGNFQDYEADKMRRLGTDSIIPHRLKYKKFRR